MREQFPQILISVLIPVYNTRHYIEQCAESLMNQTMQEGVEFLFIDDASPDDSVEILLQTIDRFPQRKSQVRVLRNSFNMGITGVRQLAVQEARGEYVAWVDSDDWVEPQMLERLYEGTSSGEIDIVVQDHIVHQCNARGQEILRQTNKLFSAESPQSALSDFWKNIYVPRGLPFQMSRRTLIERALKEVIPTQISEDTFAILYLFYYSKTVKWLEQPFYHYLKVDNGKSLTHRNFQHREEWISVKQNVDKISELLLNPINANYYKITVNYNKWFYKVLFRYVFCDAKEFWNTYNECHRDIATYFKAPTLFSRINVWLTYNSYWIFKIRIGNNYKFLA